MKLSKKDIVDLVNQENEINPVSPELDRIRRHFLLKGWSCVRNNGESMTLFSEKPDRYCVRVSNYALHNDDYEIVVGAGDEIERIEKQYEEFLIS